MRARARERERERECVCACVYGIVYIRQLDLALGIKP